MAVITRIEVVNYLSEGWQPSMGAARWRPLWPANTIRLAGQSTAIQVPNGCGKTSVTNAILFLLSRDRQLKKEFLNRCAPVEAGYTHVRIEFAIRLDEDLTQRDLITVDPLDCPAQTYVIGVCGNRGDEDLKFYRHPGTLEDSAAYRFDGSTIRFTPNDAFRAAVKKVKSDWDRWGTIDEWSKVVSEFMSPEVVRQNVVFHKSGAGDASATFKKVVVEPGERFDEAYFKQVAAPQLLANLMGDSAEEDERTIEDTITISMTRFIDAKLKVERKQAYLQQREALEAQFEPVLEAAQSIQTAHGDYQRQLQQLARDAAFLDHFGGHRRATLAGVPPRLDSLPFDADVKQCLSGMAVDMDGSVIIADDVLARILGQSTGHLNESAERSPANRETVRFHSASSQVIDFACGIKISDGSGGRRKAVRWYGREATFELAAHRASSAGNDRRPLLKQAFEIAARDIDTNPFRREHRRLSGRQQDLKETVETAKQAAEEAERLERELQQQVTQRAENQGAYQQFCEHAALLPEDLRLTPKAAEAWFEEQSANRGKAVIEHTGRVGELTAGWTTLQRLRGELGFQTLSERLAELQEQRADLEDRQTSITGSHRTVRAELEEQQAHQRQLQRALEDAERELRSLNALRPQDDQFRRLFGDVDPLTVTPPVDELRQTQRQAREKTALTEPKREAHRKLSALQLADSRFRSLFGDVDPRSTDPQTELDRLNEQHHFAELDYVQHQPLAEALDLHLQLHTVAPAAWIDTTDAERLGAERRAQQAAERIEELLREIASLEDLSLVDDADYANALNILEQAGVAHKRLRDVVLQVEPDKDRCVSVLAAFGSMLSAPVVADLDSAELAMKLLAEQRHHVPVVLHEPLLRALQGDAVTETVNGSAVAFLAGIRTRRVRAIVDPKALEEEKVDLREQLQSQEQARDLAVKDAARHGVRTDDYLRALRAQDAVRLGSVTKAAEASATLKALEPKLGRARQLTAPEVLRDLADASEYQRLGGVALLATLADEVKALAAEIEQLDKKTTELEALTTQEAIIVHDAACRFARAGGVARVEALAADVERMSTSLADGTQLLGTLQGALNAASTQLDEIQSQMKRFMQGYESTTRSLKDAIAFENEGHTAFMEAKEQTRAELERLRDELKPLGRIDFARAQTFKDHEGEDDAQLQARIGQARQARADALTKARLATKEDEQLQGLLHAADRTARDLHELTHFLVNRRMAVAPYLNDLAQREGGPTPPEAHSSFALAEQLRHRLLNWRPADGPFDSTGIAALRNEIEDIDIAKSGSDAREAKKQVAAAHSTFDSLRDAFCTRAAATETGGLSGLSQAEIEAIKAAETLEQLHELVRLGQRLRQDVAQEHEDLQALQGSAVTVEAESIETLARLVESCRANLATMNAVMARNPNARFFLETKIISGDDIKKLMIDLRDHIEERKRAAQSRTSLGRRDKDDSSLRMDVRQALINRIFTEPSVEFRHIGMWNGDRRPIQESLSEGQKAALQMMWLIKESEYHLECAVRRHLGGGSKRKLRSRSQRILFFDGLFSNLTDRALIDEAFKGLGDTGSNLQLIGLIHNPEYRNNSQIFPSLVIGRRAGWREVEGERSFVRFEDGRPDGSMGLATFMVKKPPASGLDGAAQHG